MKIILTKFKEYFISKLKLYEDERDYFLKTFYQKILQVLTGVNPNFLKDNLSYSKKNVLRGLHFQSIFPQGKLVRVVKGEVFDIVIDIRKDSKTFEKWFSTILNNINKNQLWTSKVFSHRFLATSEFADFEYKYNQYYYTNEQVSMKCNNTFFKINWPTNKLFLSQKDKNSLSLDLALNL